MKSNEKFFPTQEKTNKQQQLQINILRQSVRRIIIECEFLVTASHYWHSHYLSRVRPNMYDTKRESFSVKLFLNSTNNPPLKNLPS